MIILPRISQWRCGKYTLSQLLSLVRLSDQALEKLISYFEEADEKTIVVFFGDHQPNDTVAAPILNLNGMTTKTLTEDQLKLRYEVPYVIWANYDIDGESGKIQVQIILRRTYYTMQGFQRMLMVLICWDYNRIIRLSPRCACSRKMVWIPMHPA